MIGLPVGKNHCTYDQECIELASLAREHVTNTGGEIQMWWPDAKFSNNQIWKGSKLPFTHGMIIKGTQMALLTVPETNMVNEYHMKS